MKLINWVLLLIVIGIAQLVNGQSKPFSFAGTWINTQVEDFQKKHIAEKIWMNISPQYLAIDSEYKCTLIVRPEHSMEFGKPISKRTLGNIQELTYKKKITIYLVQIPQDPNLLVINLENNASIIFRKTN